MSHARVMPSKLHLTVPCPASLQNQEAAAASGELTPPTEEQAEGTLAHLVALKYAVGAGMEWPLGRKVKVDGHEFEIDDDMVDGAELYSEEALPGGRFENAVAIPDVHESCHGTPDYWTYITALNARRLKVVDYKYGHRYVEVFEHYQLIAYAAGVARFLDLPLDLPVILVIVQPRNYTHGAVRKHKMTVAEIYQFCAEVIAPRVALALGPNPPAYTGRHCIDCQARHICHTLQTSTASIVDYASVAEVRRMPDAAVGAELRILKDAIKLLEARYTGLYEHASNLARNGHAIAHWGMQAGQGRLKWKDDVTPDKVAAMGDLMGLDLRKPLAVKTPTQCIAAGIDKSIIDGDYAHRPTGAMRLVPDDTVRTRKIFGANRT